LPPPHPVEGDRLGLATASTRRMAVRASTAARFQSGENLLSRPHAHLPLRIRMNVVRDPKKHFARKTERFDIEVYEPEFAGLDINVLEARGVEMICHHKELGLWIAEISQGLKYVSIRKMKQAISAKPYVTLRESVGDDIEIQKLSWLSWIFVDVRRNERAGDVAADIHYVCGEIDFFHPMKITARCVEETLYLEFFNKWFQLIS
jgi:hypothetical protein